MMKPCRAIHPFGPPVGKWCKFGTVAETIARERKRLKEEAEKRQRDAVEASAKVKVIGKGKR